MPPLLSKVSHIVVLGRPRDATNEDAPEVRLA